MSISKLFQNALDIEASQFLSLLEPNSFEKNKKNICIYNLELYLFKKLKYVLLVFLRITLFTMKANWEMILNENRLVIDINILIRKLRLTFQEHIIHENIAEKIMVQGIE